MRLSDDFVGHFGIFIVPGLILGTYLAAGTMRMTRTMMLEVLRQGLHPHRLGQGPQSARGHPAARHQERADPVVTLIGLQLPLVVGGAVIMEQMSPSRVWDGC